MVRVPWHTLHEEFFCVSFLTSVSSHLKWPKCGTMHNVPYISHPHSEEANILHFYISKIKRYLLDSSFFSSHFSRMCFHSSYTSDLCLLLSSSVSWSSCACFCAVFT